MTTTVEKPGIISQTAGKPLRFTAGKLIMISPKHKNIPYQIQVRVFHLGDPTQQPAKAAGFYGRNVVNYFDWDTAKEYPYGQPYAYDASTLIGKPLLIVTEPVLVSGSTSSNIFYNRKNEPNWVMKVLYDEKVYIFVCSKKTWKHYLAVVKPERAEKYGLV